MALDKSSESEAQREGGCYISGNSFSSPLPSPARVRRIKMKYPTPFAPNSKSSTSLTLRSRKCPSDFNLIIINLRKLDVILHNNNRKSQENTACILHDINELNNQPQNSEPCAAETENTRHRKSTRFQEKCPQFSANDS